MSLTTLPNQVDQTSYPIQSDHSTSHELLLRYNHPDPSAWLRCLPLPSGSDDEDRHVRTTSRLSTHRFRPVVFVRPLVPQTSQTRMSHPRACTSSLLNSSCSNEEQVGSAVQSSSIPRSSIYLTTKLGHADRINERLEESVTKLDPTSNGYTDLFLIHAPTAGPEKRKEQWKALEGLVDRGRAKAIGVSN